MLEIKLRDFGLDDVLSNTESDLKDALGRKVSKDQKDAAIGKALGVVSTLYQLLEVIEITEETKEKGNDQVQE